VLLTLSQPDEADCQAVPPHIYLYRRLSQMEEKPFGIIYKATNKINGKCYIGQTIRRISLRISEHINLCKRVKYKNNYFHNALRKYGFDNFQWEVLCKCDTKEEMNEMEFHYIKQYNSYNCGYNLSWGGESSFGRILSEETKKKISDAKVGKYRGINSYCYGKHLSEETKRKIGNAHKGKKISDEMKKTLSMKLSGENNPNYGKHHTEEAKKKMSEKTKERYKNGFENFMKGKNHTKKTKKEMSKKAKNRAKKECPYCNKIVDVSNYSRWHGKNCKMNNESVYESE
jgi:hypothetical protein